MKATADELLTAIHKHCFACSGNNRKEVENCRVTYCYLYPYRSSRSTKLPTATKNNTVQMTFFSTEVN